MLAIIIPYYKITFFEATIQSLANQTNKRFKVYIGDDASPENPSDLLEKYIGKFNFVYYRFDSNLGGSSLVKQWERCITLSGEEEWLMILGDDDVLGENVVEEFYINIDTLSNKINVIRFSTFKINEFGNKISETYKHPCWENSSDFLFRKTRSSLSEYVFNRAKLNEVKFKDFPLAWYSDLLAVLEISDFNLVYSINSAVVQVRISEHSISGKQDNSNYKIQANFDFFNLLCVKYFNEFSGIQKGILLEKLNKCYLDDKKKFRFFINVSLIYFRKGLIIPYLNFLHQILKYSLRREL